MWGVSSPPCPMGKSPIRTSPGISFLKFFRMLFILFLASFVEKFCSNIDFIYHCTFFEITKFSKILSKLTFFSKIFENFVKFRKYFRKKCQFRKYFRKFCNFEKNVNGKWSHYQTPFFPNLFKIQSLRLCKRYLIPRLDDTSRLSLTRSKDERLNLSIPIQETQKNSAENPHPREKGSR